MPFNSSMPLHGLESGKSYRLGIFLVGAYQETLGDIHNLFGDTDAVNVRATKDGYEFAHIRHGDTTNHVHVPHATRMLSSPGAKRARRRQPTRSVRMSHEVETGTDRDTPVAQKIHGSIRFGSAGVRHVERT